MMINKDFVFGLVGGAIGILYLEYKLKNSENPGKEVPENKADFFEAFDKFTKEFEQEKPKEDLKDDPQITKQAKKTIENMLGAACTMTYDSDKISVCKKIAESAAGGNPEVVLYAADGIVAVAKTMTYDSDKKKAMDIASKLVTSSQGK